MEKLAIEFFQKFTNLTVELIYSELDAYLTQPENSRNLWNGVRERGDIVKLTKFVIMAFMAVLVSDYIFKLGILSILIFFLIIAYWVNRVINSNKKDKSKAAILLYGDSKFPNTPLPVKILFRNP